MLGKKTVNIIVPTYCNKQLYYSVPRAVNKTIHESHVWNSIPGLHIMKTCLYNFDPHQPHFYIVKVGFMGVYIIFLISAQKQIVGTC